MQRIRQVNPRADGLALAVLAWLVLALVGGSTLVRLDIAERRARFQAEAGEVHRLLSQQSAQHDAILASLVALDPDERDAGWRSSGPTIDTALQRLPGLYPQLLSVQRRAGSQPWLPAWPGDDGATGSTGSTGSTGRVLASELADAEARSLAMPAGSRSAVMTGFDPVRGRYALVLAGAPASYALWIDAQRLATTSEWPAQRTAVAASPAQRRPFIEMQLATDGGRGCRLSWSARGGSSGRPRGDSRAGGPRHQASLKALLDAGADRSLRDRDGRTALELARQRGYGAMETLLAAP